MVPRVREENHRGWAQNLFQRPSKSHFLPSLPLSIPCCHHFILPLPAPFWGEVGERGWIVYLTLICSVVSFGEMTCILGGKGQLFLFPSSESQFTAPGDLFLKLQTISRLPHCFEFTQLEGAKEEAPLLSSFSPNPIKWTHTSLNICISCTTVYVNHILYTYIRYSVSSNSNLMSTITTWTEH